MATLRRAAIFAPRNEGLACGLSSRLMARALDREAAGRSAAQVWFDAGNYVETLHQAAFNRRYDMLSPAERKPWKMREDARIVDGYQWIRRAQRLSGLLGAESVGALARMEEDRRAGPAPDQVARTRTAPR